MIWCRSSVFWEAKPWSIITFPDKATQVEGAWFSARFGFPERLLKSGEHIVSEAAVEALAANNFSFHCSGKGVV